MTARHSRVRRRAYRLGNALAVFGVVGIISSTGLVVYAASAYRPFSTTSYWNTPFESGAPTDASSGTYIADSENAANTQDYLKLTLGTFAEPIYFSTAADPIYTVSDGTNTIQVHIPNGATPASGSDGQMTVYDQAAGYNHIVDMHGVVITGGQYTINGLAAYSMSSNGLAGGAAGADDPTNYGHRGIPASTRAVRLDEIQAGAINHRLECFWWATAASHYWPMIGHENNKGGIVPEGIVVRIKPSVNLSTKGLTSAALIVATALQNYGCMVGDNSGSGNRLKLQENVDWTGILNANSLQNIPWSDWEFVQGGAVPHGTPVSDPTPPSSGGGSSSGGSSGGTSGSGSAGSTSGSSPAGSTTASGGSAPTANKAGTTSDSAVAENSPADVGKDAVQTVVTQPVATIFDSKQSAGQRLKAVAAVLGLWTAVASLSGIAFLVIRHRMLHVPAIGARPKKLA